MFKTYSEGAINTYTDAVLDKDKDSIAILQEHFSTSISKSVQWGKHIIKGTYKGIANETFEFKEEHEIEVELMIPEPTGLPKFKAKMFEVPFKLSGRPSKKLKISEKKPTDQIIDKLSRYL